MPDQVGQKRERIVIQSITETVDAEGNPVQVVGTLATVWARAEFLVGRELEAAHKINAEISVRFTVNYRTDVTEKMTVLWRTKTWNIHAIVPTEDKFSMGLMASKVE